MIVFDVVMNCACAVEHFDHIRGRYHSDGNGDAGTD